MTVLAVSSFLLISLPNPPKFFLKTTGFFSPQLQSTQMMGYF
ncbi:hypothetical protein N44_01306 [Microcystis aeruginosa NIES-44]|uniref:Uncharacterized protein n=1 Tax=Microcystis aeruginosa NIES-44 TaxID=449439 RepID=A0A0A1VTE8_MICAE|nr:hypothetical protein N44_01306 [Microcystis aeruginosa NIES-44]